MMQHLPTVSFREASGSAWKRDRSDHRVKGELWLLRVHYLEIKRIFRIACIHGTRIHAWCQGRPVENWYIETFVLWNLCGRMSRACIYVCVHLQRLCISGECFQHPFVVCSLFLLARSCIAIIDFQLVTCVWRAWPRDYVSEILGNTMQ